MDNERTTKTVLTKSSLPAGLKLAVSTSTESNKRTLKDFEPINEEATMSEVREKNQDNMVSLMKKRDGMRLAICVCMYS